MKTMSLVWLCIAIFLAGCAAKPVANEPGSGPGTGNCQTITPELIERQFDLWNTALQSGNPRAVVARYAPKSILLPTRSYAKRVTEQEKLDYFTAFQRDQPSGVIDYRFIDIDCNSFVDAGLYTFTLGRTGEKVPARYSYTYRWINGQWLITSHHSSVIP